MAAVQQRILNWLYSVLTSEYHDVNRTYSDVAQALSHYSSITPRTDVYTSETGASALLLQLSGTLPVVFRGTTYRFPITLWIPHDYPLQAPMAYVVPNEGMVVRAGQYVDPQGKVYHPYLAAWAENPHRSNVLDLLAILRDVFAKEPPVVARQHPKPITTASSSQSQQNGPPPPPRPPRPGEVQRQDPRHSGNFSSPPPAPPPPPKVHGQHALSQNPKDERRESMSLSPQARDYRHAPPLPQDAQSQQYLSRGQNNSQQEDLRYLPNHAQRPDSIYGQNPSRNDIGPRYSNQLPPSQHQLSAGQGRYMGTQQAQRQGQPPHQSEPQPYRQPQPAIAQAQKTTPLDLMNEPLDLATTATGDNLPAPPVPNNPEKDMLLRNIAAALHAERQKSLLQTASSLPGLAVQNAAMMQSMQAMQNEITQLSQLSQTLNSNTQILHSALRAADATIATSASKEPPNIDDILVAPTVVGNQLYREVCEEKAIADTIFVLGRAVERGRIPAHVFVKTTRALAREWFDKKRLVKKIGKGMGLDMVAGAYGR